MKILRITALLLMTIAGPLAAQNAVVKGHCEGLDINKTRLSVGYVQGNNLVAADTIVLDRKGSFSYQANISVPILYIFSISGHEQQAVHIMLEPRDKIELTIEYDSVNDFVRVGNSKGSKNMTVYAAFNEILYQNVKTMRDIEATGGKNANLQYQQLQQKQNGEVQQLLKSNADALVSAFLVTYFDNDIDGHLDVYDTVYNTLKDKYAKNQFVQYIGSKLSGRIGAGRQAPEIAMKDRDGKERRLSDLRGKVVLIDFWASWCRPCRMENPNVVKLYNKYHDKGFEIYSVSLDKNRADWLRAIEQDGLLWENHVSDLNGWTSSGGATYGVTSIPSTVLVGKNGEVIARNLRGQELANKLRELFGE